MFGYGYSGGSSPLDLSTSSSDTGSGMQTVHQFSPTIVGELERLFITEAPRPPPITPPTMGAYCSAWDTSVNGRSRHGSASDSGISSLSSEEEPEPIPFHANGIESPVDELDLKLLRHRASPPLGSHTTSQNATSPLPVPKVEPQTPPMTMEQLHYLMAKNRTRYTSSSSSLSSLRNRDNGCNFCKNNGEATFIYTSHRLKDDDERILCPILREYTCPNCGASGDNAHTLKYCPLSGSDAFAVGSLRTARTSTGRKRIQRTIIPDRLGRRPPPSQLLTADKFQKVIGPLL